MSVDGYAAAHERAVYFNRSDRTLRLVDGKEPARMMTGLLSGSMPPELEVMEGTALRGRAPCSTILTSKGKMVSDVRVSRLGNGPTGALLLDLPAAGTPGALAHFGRYLPPRLARVAELPEPAGVITVAGPGAATLLADGFIALDGHELSSMPEGDERVAPDSSVTGVRVIRSAEAIPPAFDLIGPASALDLWRARLTEAGVSEGGDSLREVLRIERATPAFGVEMDEDTMPAEAGIADRCIDNRKGCYTGQEVVVRIRDRGHVNRLLRGVFLGKAPVPARDVPLLVPGEDRVVGQIRSAVFSPRFAQAIALGYVRHEIGPPATLALGTPDGAMVSVRELTREGWRLVPGDPSFHP